MPKLRLSLEDLHVASFEVAAPAPLDRGTVLGREATPGCTIDGCTLGPVSCVTYDDLTCFRTCPRPTG